MIFEASNRPQATSVSSCSARGGIRHEPTEPHVSGHQAHVTHSARSCRRRLGPVDRCTQRRVHGRLLLLSQLPGSFGQMRNRRTGAEGLSDTPRGPLEWAVAPPSNPALYPGLRSSLPAPCPRLVFSTHPRGSPSGHIFSMPSRPCGTWRCLSRNRDFFSPCPTVCEVCQLTGRGGRGDLGLGPTFNRFCPHVGVRPATTRDDLFTASSPSFVRTRTIIVLYPLPPQSVCVCVCVPS
ncbi:unnamed protein product [Protopolystoma xenopodis]|uniref:Uncharacterized protein n=1 Tax=Protopolystoma xenopodis TaxID=117903 RepID=A0A3S5B9X7_9PLAT|nr:unnamed protein product [Protopolystoma xenopodis]